MRLSNYKLYVNSFYITTNMHFLKNLSVQYSKQLVMPIVVLSCELSTARKFMDVLRETIRLKHDRPIVDDNFSSKVILREDRQ